MVPEQGPLQVLYPVYRLAHYTISELMQQIVQEQLMEMSSVSKHIILMRLLTLMVITIIL